MLNNNNIINTNVIYTWNKLISSTFYSKQWSVSLNNLLYHYNLKWIKMKKIY